MQTEQLLCWSDMTDTEQHLAQISEDEDAVLVILELINLEQNSSIFRCILKIILVYKQSISTLSVKNRINFCGYRIRTEITAM